MTLYSKVEESLGTDVKGVISDNEFILLNRKDFHITQISGVHATLQQLNVNLGYPYRVLLGLLDNIVAGLTTKEINIFLTDPSLTIAAFQCWLRAGGGTGETLLYAPRGLAVLDSRSGFIGEILDDFKKSARTNPDDRPEDTRRDYFNLIIGSAKSTDQTIFAADRFYEAKKGFLVIKDYAKLESSDEREYLESKQIFPTMTFEGHAVCFKL